MKPMTLMSIFVAVFCVAVLSFGCSKQADTSKSTEQVKAEASKMTLKDLEAETKVYADAMAGKKAEMEKLTDEMKKLSIQDLMGEKGKSIKERMTKIGSEVAALSERYQIYLKKYQELGGDLSKVQVE